MTSIVDNTEHTTEYFAIDLVAGQTLSLKVHVGDLGACGGVNTAIAYPDAGYRDSDWATIMRGEGSTEWPVPVSGRYPLQVRDCGGGRPVQYTITFTVMG